MSRILFRLSLAWLALVALGWIFAHTGDRVDPGDLPLTYTMLAIPGAVGLVLAWVFLPPKR